MKLSQGFTRLIPSVLIAVFYLPSFIFLTLALRKIDVSVSYANWSGLGMASIAAIGIIWFHEPVAMVKIISLALIILGVVGLNISEGGH